MDSRERTYLALDHQAGDRIPIDFWASVSMKRKLERALGLSWEQFLDHYDVDLRYIAGPKYIGPPLGEGEDIWGVQRTAITVNVPGGTESYKEVAESPLIEDDSHILKEAVGAHHRIRIDLDLLRHLPDGGDASTFVAASRQDPLADVVGDL